MRNKRLWKTLMLATVCTVALGTTSTPVFAAEVTTKTAVSTEAETETEKTAEETPNAQEEAETSESKQIDVQGELTGVDFVDAVNGVVTVKDEDFYNGVAGILYVLHGTPEDGGLGDGVYFVIMSSGDFGVSSPYEQGDAGNYPGFFYASKDDLVASGGTKTYNGTFKMIDDVNGGVDDTLDYSVTVKYESGSTETPETPDTETPDTKGELTGVDFTNAVLDVITLTDASFDKNGYAELPVVVHGTPGLDENGSVKFDVHSEGDLGMCNPQDMEGNGNYTGSFYVSKDDIVKAGGTKVFNGTFIMQGGSPGVPDDTLDFSITVKYQSANSGQHHVEVPEGQSSLSKGEMDVLVNINKDNDIIIKTSEGVYYSFGKGTIHAIDGKESYDLGLDLIQDFSQFPQIEGKEVPFSKNEFGFYIKYNYSGELPGTAQITIPVDKKLAGQTLYYYEVMEDGTYQYTGQNAVVSENGTYTVMQDHCSDYVALTKMLTGNEQKPEGDNGNTEKPDGNNGNEQKPDGDNGDTQKPEESKPITGETVKPETPSTITGTQNTPKTGDMTAVLPVLGTGLSSLGIAVAAIFRKRK